MEWKAKLEKTETLLDIPSYILHDRMFEIVHNKEKYQVKFHQKLNTLFVRKEGELAYRNIKLKRVHVEKPEDAQEFGVDFEFLSGGSLTSADARGEAWIYTPASEQRRKAQAAKGAAFRSPMTGKVLKVFTENGATVKKGETLLIIEAMKMENKIGAPADGVLEGFKVKEGQNLNANESLGQIKAKSENDA